MDTNTCLPQISLALFFISLTCKIAEGTPGVNALQQLLTENGRGTGYNSFETPETKADDQSMQQLLQELQLAKVLQLMKESNAAEQGSKRVFCGKLGCRNGKRTLNPARRQTLSKRPFCNGFFGCSNGKRSKPMSIVEDSPLPEVPETSEPQKRLFCNFRGCGNFKRSLYDALLDNLKSNKDLTESEGSELQILKDNDPIQLIIDQPLNDQERRPKSEGVHFSPYQKRLSQKVLPKENENLQEFPKENEMCSDYICKKWLYRGRRKKKLVVGGDPIQLIIDQPLNDQERRPKAENVHFSHQKRLSENVLPKENENLQEFPKENEMCSDYICKKWLYGGRRRKKLVVGGDEEDDFDYENYRKKVAQQKGTKTDKREKGIERRCFSYNTRVFDC